MKPSKKSIKALACKFPYSTWCWLNSKMEFLNALAESIEQAEAVASKLLIERPDCAENLF